MTDYHFDWHARAACKDCPDPDAFFPEQGGGAAEALAYCARCPVTRECLRYAEATNTKEGIWGGVHLIRPPGKKKGRKAKGQQILSIPAEPHQEHAQR